MVTLLTACVVGIHAQVGRTFVKKLSEDGRAELHCSLPRYAGSGRAVIACPGGAYRFLSFEKEGTDWAAWFTTKVGLRTSISISWPMDS